MTRIKKRGLDYFPMDNEFINGRLVRRIMKREGDAALAVLVHLLTQIYCGEGYYLQADDTFCEDLADSMYEKKAGDIRRVISLAVEYGLFDAELFGKYGILTSADIQRQYLFSTKRRTVSDIAPDYCLLTEEECSSLRQKRVPKSAPEAEPQTEHHPQSRCETVAQTPPMVSQNPVEREFSTAQPYFGTHSIAQQSIAQQSREKQSTTNLPCPPWGTEGEERGRSVGREEPVFRTSAPNYPASHPGWTPESIALLRPPADGLKRNLPGLVENLRMYDIPPAEQYALICKSNFGVIGHPIWRGLGTLRDSGGKIKLPGRYLLSLFNRA